MKSIANFFKSFLSLGWLGLIILMMLVTILFGSLSYLLSSSVDISHERMAALNLLENDASFTLRDMMLKEAYQTFVYEYGVDDKTDYAQQAKDANQQITDLFVQMENDGHFADDRPFSGDIQEALTAFNNRRQTHRTTFEKMVAEYQNGNTEAAQAILADLQSENFWLKSDLNDLVIVVERGRLQAVKAIPEDTSTGLWFGSISMVVMLLLGLLGYGRIAANIRPLSKLSNAVMAIGGDLYRPEMLAGVLKKVGPVGSLARALDALAKGLQERNAGLKTEIERLRQELYESRRKRLKIARPVEEKRSVTQ